MKIERIITIFEKEKSGKYLKEINADNVNVLVLSKLYKPYDDDPCFYRPFHIDRKQYDELIKYIDELKDYSYFKYDLYIEAVTVT